MGGSSVVPGRELGVGRLEVLGTVTCVVEIVIILVWPVELDLKKVVGGCIPKNTALDIIPGNRALEFHTVMSLTSATAIIYYHQWWLL